MRNVRAKFRCMSVTKHWDGQSIVTLRPVYKADGDSVNSKFWEATPSGEAELRFKGSVPGLEYESGVYYYIDMMESEAGGWCLTSITHTSNGSGSVELNTNGTRTVAWGEDGFTHGVLRMGIDNKLAMESFKKPGSS